MSAGGRYSGLLGVYGVETLNAINSSCVLVVGAGGIGCEVLKNLVMSGFKQIDVIDLDTVDISNLNRQFLFRPEHVNHPKSTVAAASAMAFNPEVRIRAFHQNIKDSQFNHNLDARRHVNRLCLAYGIPLIESGTTGYIGQAMPIIKNVTECYECQPKITQKVYPICTIRSTPSQPVHCIVWGKEFYKLVFGNRPESLLFEDESTEESTFMKYLPFPTSVQGSPPPALVISYAINILKALFCTEIDKKKSMGLYRTSDRIPEPLDQATLTEAEEFATKLFVHGEALSRPSERRGWERNEWNLVDCLIELISCFISIYCDEDRRSLIGSFVFDKDDRLAMIFVTASSVIRSRIFRISCLSYHDTKGVAGNIIPAIASTNAIIAGLQVVEAIRLLQMKFTSTKITPQLCRTTYCQRMPTRRGYYLQPTVSPDPNPKCYICGTSQLIVEVDTDVMTLATFVHLVAKQRLGLVEPSLMIGSSIVYEEGDDSDATLSSYTTKPLRNCIGGGIKDGTILTLVDFRQDLTISLVVSHVESKDFEEESHGFRVIGSHEPRTVAKGDNHKPSPSTSEMDTKKMSSALVDEGDVIEIILDEMPHTAKRLREEQNDDDIEIIDPSSQEVKRGRFG